MYFRIFFIKCSTQPKKPLSVSLSLLFVIFSCRSESSNYRLNRLRSAQRKKDQDTMCPVNIGQGNNGPPWSIYIPAALSSTIWMFPHASKSKCICAGLLASVTMISSQAGMLMGISWSGVSVEPILIPIPCVLVSCIGISICVWVFSPISVLVKSSGMYQYQ